MQSKAATLESNYFGKEVMKANLFYDGWFKKQSTQQV
jgi:hypothetical protein